MTYGYEDIGEKRFRRISERTVVPVLLTKKDSGLPPTNNHHPLPLKSDSLNFTHVIFTLGIEFSYLVTCSGDRLMRMVAGMGLYGICKIKYIHDFPPY